MSGIDPPRLQAYVTPAIARGDDSWSCEQVAGLVQYTAERLSSLGLQAGQAVLQATDHPLDLLLLQHALAQAGAGLLPYPLDMSAAARDQLAAGAGAEWHWERRMLVATGHRRHAAAEHAVAPALLVRTSGSSGAPKLVMLTHSQLLASAARVNAALDLRSGDQWLCVLPLHHIGGLAIGWRCALAGATLRLVAGQGAAAGLCLPDELQEPASASGGFDAGQTARTLSAYPVTHLSLVPTMLARLLEIMPAPPPSLRMLLLGGQALHAGLAQRAVTAGWPLYVSYGMSETGSMVAVGRWQDDDMPGTRVGLPLPQVELDCADADEGEPPRVLRLRGPMLMAGYAGASRRPGQGLDDGWLTTADLCRRDADGTLRVFGRADELLVIGGEQVSPNAVEARLTEAPGVREVSVVGLPHPDWGSTLAACWSGPATPTALADWCRAELPPRECPRIFRRFDTLPLLPSGKPDRAALLRAVSAPGPESLHKSGADQPRCDRP